ncbi:hypothetical protein SOVF_212340, partial [Spinacia oleracea]
VDPSRKSSLYEFWHKQLKCGGCGEVTKKETCAARRLVSPIFKEFSYLFKKVSPIPIPKGFANLVQKCKGCGRVGSVQLIPGAGRPLKREDFDSGRYAVLMSFRCQGFEPDEYSFGGHWRVESTKGSVYEDVDLSEGDWAEYDEDEAMPVSVCNLKARFVRINHKLRVFPALFL